MGISQVQHISARKLAISSRPKAQQSIGRQPATERTRHNPLWVISGHCNGNQANGCFRPEADVYDKRKPRTWWRLLIHVSEVRLAFCVSQQPFRQDQSPGPQHAKSSTALDCHRQDVLVSSVPAPVVSSSSRIDNQYCVPPSSDGPDKSIAYSKLEPPSLYMITRLKIYRKQEPRTGRGSLIHLVWRVSVTTVLKAAGHFPS